MKAVNFPLVFYFNSLVFRIFGILLLQQKGLNHHGNAKKKADIQSSPGYEKYPTYVWKYSKGGNNIV
jgi:hypothetical protein